MILKKKIAIIYLLLLVAFASCTGNKRYDDLMQRADSLMDCNDDSAKNAIKLLDEVKPQLDDFTKSQRMHYELLRHKVMNKVGITFTSDSVMREVVDYYDHHGSANERMLANYVMGCVYRDLHEAPLALEFYNKAVEQADTTATDCDYGTLYRVYSQMGFLFSNQYLPYQLLEAFGKAEKYAYLAKDTLNAIINYQNREDAYSYFGNKDSVIAINLRAAKMFKQIGNNYAAAIALGSNYSYYIEKHDTLNAQKAFKAYFSTGYEGNSEYEDSKAYVLCQKGIYYTFTAQLDSAYYYLQQSLRLCKSYNNKVATFNALARYYSKVNQPMLAMKYALKSSEYNDSDLIESRKTQLQQMQALYNYNRNQEIANKYERKALERKYTIYFTIIVCTLIVLTVIIVFRKKAKKQKRALSNMQELYQTAIDKINDTKVELFTLQNLNDEKLSALIKEKESEIEKLQLEINKYDYINNACKIIEQDKQLQTSPIYIKIISIVKNPRKHMSIEDWKQLEATLEHVVPSFIEIKRKVNVKEYHICLLIRLYFIPSEISVLIGTTLSDVSVSRKRLCNKILGKAGTAKEFDRYIKELI